MSNMWLLFSCLKRYYLWCCKYYGIGLCFFYSSLNYSCPNHVIKRLNLSFLIRAIILQAQIMNTHSDTYTQCHSVRAAAGCDVFRPCDALCVLCATMCPIVFPWVCSEGIGLTGVTSVCAPHTTRHCGYYSFLMNMSRWHHHDNRSLWHVLDVKFHLLTGILWFCHQRARHQHTLIIPAGWDFHFIYFMLTRISVSEISKVGFKGFCRMLRKART